VLVGCSGAGGNCKRSMKAKTLLLSAVDGVNEKMIDLNADGDSTGLLVVDPIGALGRKKLTSDTYLGSNQPNICIAAVQGSRTA
jgi:hypothetical protein